MATSTKKFNKPKSASLFARKKFSSGISLRYPLEEDEVIVDLFQKLLIIHLNLQSIKKNLIKKKRLKRLVILQEILF